MWLNENCFLNCEMRMALMIFNLNQLINCMLGNVVNKWDKGPKQGEGRKTPCIMTVLNFCSCWCIKMFELLQLFLCSSITIFPFRKGECCIQGQPLEATFAVSVEVIRCQHSLIASNCIMNSKFLKDRKQLLKSLRLQ